MSYYQRDSHYGDRNPLSMFWVPLNQDNLHTAKIQYEKGDGSLLDFVIVREEIKAPLFGFHVRSESITQAESLATQGNGKLQLLVVKGRRLVWGTMTPEAKTLPSNRLGIDASTRFGNSFIGATKHDQIGQLLNYSSKWMVLVAIDKDGKPLFEAPDKVLIAKSL